MWDLSMGGFNISPIEYVNGISLKNMSETNVNKSRILLNKILYCVII